MLGDYIRMRLPRGARTELGSERARGGQPAMRKREGFRQLLPCEVDRHRLPITVILYANSTSTVVSAIQAEAAYHRKKYAITPIQQAQAAIKAPPT